MTTQITTSALIPDQTKKIFYIDNLKVLLTILVILHHAFITYGASGGWYYQQKTSLKAALIPMTIFVSVNQAFFMGFFFFLSAYFIRPSFYNLVSLRFLTYC
jgi:peptidoglycan/LPS O-acetylase OafA/YrhL